ncbi:MAG: tetratricopeptide repeat protein, partial [Verrucomicrobia bacterium]|nr:tetratricopeptide repeat protein [Verrucomicrobiota bacterium]
MSPHPAIFVSAVSRELRSARQLVANTLTFLGYNPEWQDIFGTEDGDLRAMLRRRIDQCQGVVQLVGRCYGAEPPTIDQEFGRVSYTQYEALYAVSKGKKVWYLFLDEGFPTDAHEAEDDEKSKLQADYRLRLQTDSHLYHPLGSKEGLEASVLKLRDDLTRLRRGFRRWAAFVAVLLAVIAALSVWLVESQQHTSRQQQQTNEQLLTLQAKFEKLQQGVNSFVDVQNKVRQEQAGQRPDQVEQRTYEELSKQLGIDTATLKEQLPRFAQELKQAPNATTYERANAAYVAKDYNEAERLALAAADEAQRASPPKNAEAIKAFELAAWAAEKRIEYADALKQLSVAEELTDRTRDGGEWARVQFAKAWVLHDQGKYRDAEELLREVLREREHLLGANHPDALAARHRLALALVHQGKYAEAETEFRTVVNLDEKVFGAEHPETLGVRNGLGLVLAAEGKSAEAEAEYRAVIKLREKVLGPEHPDTLGTRSNLASAL